MPYISIPSHDGKSFKAYIAMPSRPGPAVIMIQEIFGVNHEMRDKCDALAKKGYVAICPDLFWRIEPGIELVDSVPDQLNRAFDLFGKFDVKLGLEDLKSTLGYMREFDGVRGKIGCIGYCLGGKLAFMMACHSDIDAAVSYYGVGIESMTDDAQGMRKNVLMHIAENDQYVPPEAQEKIKLALMPNRRFEIYTYPGADHAFARGNGMHYNPTAARDANERTEIFLDRYLRDENQRRMAEA